MFFTYLLFSYSIAKNWHPGLSGSWHRTFSCRRCRFFSDQLQLCSLFSSFGWNHPFWDVLVLWRDKRGRWTRAMLLKEFKQFMHYTHWPLNTLRKSHRQVSCEWRQESSIVSLGGAENNRTILHLPQYPGDYRDD